MSAIIMAVVLSLLSAAGYAGAAVAQQQVATRPMDKRLFARRGWWLAVALNGAAALLHVAALRYGPLSLVQPLGALTLVLAVPLAAVTASRPVNRREWRGAAVTMIGLAGIFALTSPVADADRQVLDLYGVLALSAVTGVALLLLVPAARTAGGVAGSLLYATAAGAAFAVGSALTKTITVAYGSGTTLLVAAVAGTAAMATAGMLLAQSAYRGSEIAAPTATVALVNPLISAAIGITLLGEHMAAGTTGALLALGFGVVAARGVITLVTAEPPKPEPTDQPDDRILVAR
jgi:uncharacterized membrane protein